MYKWNGKELKEAFAVDFYQQKLGRAHIMRFGSAALKAANTETPSGKLTYNNIGN